MKSAARIDRTPVIVASNEINSLPATPGQTESSLTGIVSHADLSAGEEGAGEGSFDAGTIVTKAREPAKPDPVEVAEIMPQYPGGIQALLCFLKKNTHSPNMEAGEDISVKIEFLVNYNGSLENFRIIQSGGEIFDAEVLRVFKKMPLWVRKK